MKNNVYLVSYYDQYNLLPTSRRLRISKTLRGGELLKEIIKRIHIGGRYPDPVIINFWKLGEDE